MCDFKEYNEEIISLCSIDLMLSQNKEFTEEQIVEKLNTQMKNVKNKSAVPTDTIVKSAIDVLLNRSKIMRTPFAFQVV